MGWLLRADFPPFFFDFLEVTEPISLVFIFSDIFTVFKGLGMFFSSDIPVRYSSLLGILACFGVTLRYSVLNSYWVTSEIAYSVRTLESKSSAHNLVSLE